MESLLVGAIVCDVVAYWSHHSWCRACWGRHSFRCLLKPSFVNYSSLDSVTFFGGPSFVVLLSLSGVFAFVASVSLKSDD
ncbi:16449_t:CDS:2 [Dentiscutata erythropus]|uniref:16449_t:CDS:1 n=1 Tax=Dentiscutata erythropus TaxID=1348616 RepID=A0A9N9A4Q2_9GLOM|nr:16449_t:CDS:2 [Dentiscutata erythropus]